MDGMDFDDLLTGELSATVRWQQSYPCPCTIETGSASRTCLSCLGKGRVLGNLSDEFRCGLVGQTARAKAAIAQTMGPGFVGDSIASIPCSAPCYSRLSEGDRLYDQKVEDHHKIILIPGVKLAIPVGAKQLTAYVVSGAGFVRVTPPVLDSSRRVEVLVGTTLDFMAPRCYEVVKELGQVRSFGFGLPKKWGLKLLDMSIR